MQLALLHYWRNIASAAFVCGGVSTLLVGLLGGFTYEAFAASPSDVAGQRAQHIEYACALSDLDKAAQRKKPVAPLSYLRGRMHQALIQHETAANHFLRVPSTSPVYRNARTCLARAQKSRHCPVELDPAELANAWNDAYPDATTEAERYRQAERHFDAVLSAYDLVGGADRYLSWGRYFIAEGELDVAQVAFNRVLARQPRHMGAFAGRGNVFFAKQRYARAIADYDKAVENVQSRIGASFEAYIGALELRAIAFFRLQKYEQAISAFDEVIKLVPFHHHALAGRSDTINTVRWFEGKPPIEQPVVPVPVAVTRGEALSSDYIQWAIFGDLDQLPRIVRRLGSLKTRARKHLERGLYDRAFSEYETILRLDPERIFLHRNLGDVRLAWGKFNQAITEYNKLAEHSPGTAAGLFERARAYRAKGDVKQAITELSNAIAIEPDDRRSYIARGELHTMLGQHDLAANDFDRGRGAELDRPLTYFNRAFSYLITGRPLEALVDLSDAIELSPKFVRAYELKAIVHLALAHRIGGRNDASNCNPATVLFVD